MHTCDGEHNEPKNVHSSHFEEVLQVEHSEEDHTGEGGNKERYSPKKQKTDIDNTISYFVTKWCIIRPQENVKDKLVDVDLDGAVGERQELHDKAEENDDKRTSNLGGLYTTGEGG